MFELPLPNNKGFQFETLRIVEADGFQPNAKSTSNRLGTRGLPPGKFAWDGVN
jgi:hypothetical protein